MPCLSTILIKSSDLERIAALSDRDLLDIFDELSGPSRSDPQVAERIRDCGFQAASLGDENLDHVHVLRDGVLRELNQEHADAEDLRVISDVMRARGVSSRIDGTGRAEKSGDPVDRQSWFDACLREDVMVTLVVDHSFAPGDFGAEIGGQVMASVEGFLATIREQPHVATGSGVVKPVDRNGMSLLLQPPGSRKPLHIAAITPGGQTDVIITGKDRSRTVRPFDSGPWLEEALDADPRGNIICSIIEGLEASDMKTLTNVLLMHGYTVLDGKRVMRPYLWNKENWGAASGSPVSSSA